MKRALLLFMKLAMIVVSDRHDFEILIAESINKQRLRELYKLRGEKIVKFIDISESLEDKKDCAILSSILDLLVETDQPPLCVGEERAPGTLRAVFDDVISNVFEHAQEVGYNEGFAEGKKRGREDAKLKPRLADKGGKS